MTGKYFSEDTEQRKNYFEKQFISHAQAFARNNGISLNELFSKINNFEDFTKILEIVWSRDTSLLSYYEGMGNKELREFYNRNKIQQIVKEEKLPAQIPDEVIQVKKKTRLLFKGFIKEKKTGIKKRIFAKQTFVEIRGKKYNKYRDLRGRFARVE